MMKSLLVILKEEDNAVHVYNRNVNAIHLFVREREIVKANPFDCETKSEAILQYNELISEYEKKAEEEKQKVNQARKELRNYISMLLENE